MKNNFDKVMKYIDAHITEDTESIKKGIISTIGYNSKMFGDCFTVLTGESLFHYISMRRLYWAAKELKECKDKSICEIAMEYGYSEQSAFTRTMRAFWDATPTDIRRGTVDIPENKYVLQQLATSDMPKGETRTQKMLLDLDVKGNLSPLNWKLFGDLECASTNYDWDIDTCYAIADIAEKIGVSYERLLEVCYHATLSEELDEYNQLGYGISKREELCMILDLDSEDELDAICEYFKCKFYDVDGDMVEKYRKCARADN